MVLADYRTNSDTINHAVVKMLHRVSVDLKMAPLLYQLSVFTTMQNILHEPTTGRYKVRPLSLPHTINITPSYHHPPPHTITPSYHIPSPSSPHPTPSYHHPSHHHPLIPSPLTAPHTITPHTSPPHTITPSPPLTTTHHPSSPHTITHHLLIPSHYHPIIITQVTLTPSPLTPSLTI